MLNPCSCLSHFSFADTKTNHAKRSAASVCQADAAAPKKPTSGKKAAAKKAAAGGHEQSSKERQEQAVLDESDQARGRMDGNTSHQIIAEYANHALMFQHRATKLIRVDFH